MCVGSGSHTVTGMQGTEEVGWATVPLTEITVEIWEMRREVGGGQT